MRFLYLALILLLCTCVRAQTDPPPDYLDGPPGDPVGHEGDNGKPYLPFECHTVTPDDYKPLTAAELVAAKTVTDTFLPKVYIEVDHDQVLLYGGAVEARIWTLMMFQVVQRLYRPGAIIPQPIVYVHEFPSNYVATSSFGSLQEFRTETPSHPGDVGILTSGRASGGVAFVDQICGPANTPSPAYATTSHPGQPTAGLQRSLLTSSATSSDATTPRPASGTETIPRSMAAWILRAAAPTDRFR